MYRQQPDPNNLSAVVFELDCTFIAIQSFTLRNNNKKFPQKGDNYIWFVLQLNTIQENEIGLYIFKQYNCQYKLGKIFMCVYIVQTDRNIL